MNDQYAVTSLERINAFLDRPVFKGFTDDDLFIKQFIKKGWGQDIAALSNIAEALRNLYETGSITQTDLEPRMARLVDYALHPSVSPWKRPITAKTNLGGYGYYLEHLNIILGCYQATIDDRYLDLNALISEHLIALTRENPLRHARLLPHIQMRWCADQAAILYSVWLFDQNNHSTLHHKTTSEWLNIMNAQLTHRESGLYQTEALGVKNYSKQPRGCSSAYMIYYMGHFAPETAAAQWQLFKSAMYEKTLGFSGFREYLPTYNGQWTPDSGPIIGGIGVAASALAIKAAGVVGDTATQQMLITSANRAHGVINKLSHVPGASRFTRIATDMLASGIYLAGSTTSLRTTTTAMAA